MRHHWSSDTSEHILNQVKLSGISEQPEGHTRVTGESQVTYLSLTEFQPSEFQPLVVFFSS